MRSLLVYGLSRGLLVLLLSKVLTGQVSAQQPQATGDLYAQNCAVCHGPAGQGRICPQLAGRSFDKSAFTSQVRGGGHAMPAFAATKLTDAQITDLQAYIAAFPQPAASELTPAADDSAPGAKIYAANCAMCHGPDARGLMGPGILNTPMNLADFTQQVHNGGKTMPPFPKLADSDVQAIYRYLHPVREARPDAAVGTVIPSPGTPKFPMLTVAVLVALVVVLVVIAMAARRRRWRSVEAQRAADARIAAELTTHPGAPVQIRVS